jgi:hypothetical protein
LVYHYEECFAELSLTATQRLSFFRTEPASTLAAATTTTAAAASDVLILKLPLRHLLNAGLLLRRHLHAFGPLLWLLTLHLLALLLHFVLPLQLHLALVLDRSLLLALLLNRLLLPLCLLAFHALALRFLLLLASLVFRLLLTRGL